MQLQLLQVNFFLSCLQWQQYAYFSKCAIQSHPSREAFEVKGNLEFRVHEDKKKSIAKFLPRSEISK